MRLLFAAMTMAAVALQAAETLNIGDGRAWAFYPGEWTDTADGLIRPPDRRNLHSRAFYLAKAFRDATVEFEFNPSYRETGTGNAGLILRAAGPEDFYLVHFPWGGQQLRAKHFWAGVAQVNGDAYIRNLAFEWVPGVPSETDRWYRVRVVAEGPQVSVWVDGRRAARVPGIAVRSGYLGFAGYGWYAFRNVRVTGSGAGGPKWNRAARISAHARELPISSKVMPSNCLAPNGDVLLAAGSVLLRSRDAGRSWGPAEKLPESLGEVGDYGNTMFRTGRGRLMVMLYRTQASLNARVPQILIAESTDNGRTWTGPVAAQVEPDWPELPHNLIPYGPLVETADGTLVRFLYGGMGAENREAAGKITNVVTWSAVHAKAFAIRSTDGGKSWSAPIEIDQPSWTDRKRGTITGSLDLTEPTGVAIGNRITALVRPVYSSTMWQCWSGDAGASWDAAARTTFPGYAQSMVRTRAGAIVVARRYPNYAVNLSTDDGLNWDQGTIIDYPAWAMGSLLEVEPGTVLATYMGAGRDRPLLSQLIRITPRGIEPVWR